MARIGGSASTGKASAVPLKSWVREALRLDDDAVVTVSELECTEPGCPPIETAVTVFVSGDDPFLVKIPKAVADLDRSDLLSALAFGHGH
jgi:hypothetical protein